jgi:hypothetical protein
MSIDSYHLHIDPRFGEADLDVVLPMRRLSELAQTGVVGRAAGRHYSVMGYILDAGVPSNKRRRRSHHACARMVSTPPRSSRHDPSAAGP